MLWHTALADCPVCEIQLQYLYKVVRERWHALGCCSNLSHAGQCVRALQMEERVRNCCRRVHQPAKQPIWRLIPLPLPKSCRDGPHCRRHHSRMVQKECAHCNAVRSANSVMSKIPTTLLSCAPRNWRCRWPQGRRYVSTAQNVPPITLRQIARIALVYPKNAASERKSLIKCSGKGTRRWVRQAALYIG